RRLRAAVRTGAVRAGTRVPRPGSDAGAPVPGPGGSDNDRRGRRRSRRRRRARTPARHPARARRRRTRPHVRLERAIGPLRSAAGAVGRWGLGPLAFGVARCAALARKPGIRRTDARVGDTGVTGAVTDVRDLRTSAPTTAPLGAPWTRVAGLFAVIAVPTVLGLVVRDFGTGALATTLFHYSPDRLIGGQGLAVR